MNGLFTHQNLPVWSRLRPGKWEDFSFFSDLKTFRDNFLSSPFSFILYGPPGIGKTTFIELLLRSSEFPSEMLPATSTSLEELRKISKKHAGAFILFLDELHRFSKSRQDYLLKPIEEGRIILAGATTESPWYYFTRPLLSRVRLKEMEPPEKEKFSEIVKKNYLKKSQTRQEQEGDTHFEDVLQKAEIWNRVIDYTWPDFRNAYLALEHLSANLPVGEALNNPTAHYEKVLKEFFENNRIYNKNREKYSYDLMSAFIKSIRGSDIDASILYLAKLLDLDVDPAFIARRLVIAASEDIGLANSQAAILAEAVMNTVEKIGMPEARIPLAHATIYLAASPKSNSAYKAVDRALKIVRDITINPPLHIVNHSEKINDYRYPHDFGGFVDQNYWPEDLEKENLYQFKGSKFENSMESRINEAMKKLKI